ncbi:TetR/AcrR family transcriptional regulator [Caulobacter sp.]|uniref:TetR/AcrR family transcriptional regulator n=1 Tax=Caulobacter sp. TaxID=78 RepID=UPI002B4A14C6|nr:TetR/AcrR family transcriptional regulator [Caulobacter sp.]HJV43589.1 TetR/AcrR family transcriptional regulator [Caulobacter sp.]
MPARALPPLHTGVSPSTPAEERPDNARQRLTAAAAQLVADGGIAAASARAIAASAGTAASAINYNFGNIERLLSTVFKQSVEETRAWLEHRARELNALPRSPDGAAFALLHVLDAWRRDEGRRLALTYQEAVTADPGRGVAAAWTRVWRDFWTDVARDFGLAPIDGRVLHAFFEHEALYNLSTWSPALEALALTEMVERFAALWLDAPDRAPRGAVVVAERAAGIRPYGSVPPAAMRIAKAAALVVEDKGLTGLTHRAVAARAGVTTGSVTHHFRSIEDLVAGAIRGQVQAMTDEAGSGAPPPVDDLVTIEGLFEALRLHVTAELPSPPVIRRRRLFLAAVRRPELAGAGAVIRFAYGGTLRDSLGRVFGLDGPELVMQASVLARVMAAIWFACAGDEDPGASRQALFDRITARFRVGIAARRQDHQRSGH